MALWDFREFVMIGGSGCGLCNGKEESKGRSGTDHQKDLDCQVKGLRFNPEGIQVGV